MKSRPMRALLCLAGFLVACLAVEYQMLRPEDDSLALVSNRSPLPAPAHARPMPADDIQRRVDLILARPIFSPTRRGPPGALTSASGRASLPRLTAVLISGRGKTVIFAGEGNAKPVALSEGGHIGPYVVRAIGPGQATLAGPDGEHVLRPMFDGEAGASSTARVVARPSMLDDLLRQSTPLIAVPGLEPAQAPR